MWLNIEENKTVLFTQYYPFDYFITNQRILNLGKHPDAQYSVNRAGRLCGGYRENYSLAIETNMGHKIPHQGGGGGDEGEERERKGKEESKGGRFEKGKKSIKSKTGRECEREDQREDLFFLLLCFKIFFFSL